MVEHLIGMVMDSVMTWTTLKTAILMMVTVVDYLWRETSVLTVLVNVSKKKIMLDT